MAAARIGDRVPLAPSSLLGLLYSVGMLTVALSIDMGAGYPDGVRAIQAFYFRKAIRPALFMQAIQAFLLTAGTVNYASALIAAVRTQASLKRKLFDVLGAAIFVANAALAVLVIAPLEKRVGATFTGDAQPTHDDLQWLYNWHFLALGLAGFIGFCQAMAYAAHVEDEKRVAVADALALAKPKAE